MSYTICVSGPESTRANVEVALESARIPILPSDHHNAVWGRKVAAPHMLDASHAVLVVDHPDVDAVVEAVREAGWVLRTHHESQAAPSPLLNPLGDLERRLAAVEASLPRPPMRGGAVESPAAFNQASTYTAEQTRRAIFASYARTAANNPGIITGGLISTADLQLSAPGSGMSVNISTGECVIGGTEGGSQGGYVARATSTTNLVISTANASNPRIDTVVGTISDSGYTEPTGGSGDQWALQVITGTPTAGATLANLNGKGTVPLSSLVLGYVLVPATATNIITADISNVATVVGFGAFTLPTSLTVGPWLGGPAGVTGIGTYPLVPGAVQSSGSATVQQGLMYLDPAILKGGAQLRVRALCATNQVAPATTITFGLYPVTATFAASGSNNTYALGTVTPSSTVAFATPGASSQNQNSSSAFSFPAAGYYVLGVNFAAGLAAGCRVDLLASLHLLSA